MTDLERTKEFFKSLDEESYKKCCIEDSEEDGDLIFGVQEESGTKFDGYCMFFVKFTFDKEGKFKKLFIGE